VAPEPDPGLRARVGMSFRRNPFPPKAWSAGTQAADDAVASVHGDHSPSSPATTASPPAEYDAMPSVSAGWVLLRVPALLVEPCHINDLDSATVNSGIEGLFMGRSSQVDRIRPKSPQDIRLPNYPDHIQW
jgi:hypothetical protein